MLSEPRIPASGDDGAGVTLAGVGVHLLQGVPHAVHIVGVHGVDAQFQILGGHLGDQTGGHTEDGHVDLGVAQIFQLLHHLDAGEGEGLGLGADDAHQVHVRGSLNGLGAEGPDVAVADDSDLDLTHNKRSFSVLHKKCGLL